MPFELSPFGLRPKGSFLWLGFVKQSRDFRVMNQKQPVTTQPIARDFRVMNQKQPVTTQPIARDFRVMNQKQPVTTQPIARDFRVINDTANKTSPLKFFLSQIGLLML